MKPGIYTLVAPAFIFHAGDVFELIDNTYTSEICDVCGQKRRCDWLTYMGPESKTGMDCCRSCQRKILKEVDE